MCLGTVNKHKPAVTEGKGYKLFRVKGGQQLLPFIQGGLFYVYDHWYEAEGLYLQAGDHTNYDCGFHIYTRKSISRLKRELDAVWELDSDYVLAEVEYRDARVKGTQDRIPVVVAKQMRILRVVVTFS